MRRLAQNREAARKSRLRKKVCLIQFNYLLRNSRKVETEKKKIVKTHFIFFLLYEKQAYVQQLESSRLKLTQLEQDLQRARSQVLNSYIVLYSLSVSIFI